MSAVAKMRARHEGQKCVSLGFLRSQDSRQPATMRFMITDSDMKLEALLDFDAKQFADLLSGLATWVDDGLAK